MSERDDQEEQAFLLSDQLRDCIRSRTLRDILGRCPSSITNIQELFTSMNSETSAYELRFWEGRNAFLVDFFENKLEDQNYNITLAELVEVLKGIKECSSIVKEIKDRFNVIRQETRKVIDDRRSASILTATHVRNQDRHQIIINIPETPLSKIIYVVFHRDQLPQKKSDSPEQQRHLSVDCFIDELENTFADSALKFQKVDLAEINFDDLGQYVNGRSPVFLLYDKELHDTILDLDENLDSSRDKHRKFRRFYHLAYDRYCRDGCVNKWFYPFCLEDFSSTYASDNHFKYRWLLQTLDRERVAKFKQVPLGNPATRELKDKLKIDLNDFKQKFGKKLVSA